MITHNIIESDISIELINDRQFHTDRAYQQGNKIKIFLDNIKNRRVAAQTVIHEMTHYYYHVGKCQHAEAICFAMEKMHLLERDFLYEDEECTKPIKRTIEDFNIGLSVPGKLLPKRIPGGVLLVDTEYKMR